MISLKVILARQFFMLESEQQPENCPLQDNLPPLPRYVRHIVYSYLDGQWMFLKLRGLNKLESRQIQANKTIERINEIYISKNSMKVLPAILNFASKLQIQCYLDAQKPSDCEIVKQFFTKIPNTFNDAKLSVEMDGFESEIVEVLFDKKRQSNGRGRKKAKPFIFEKIEFDLYSVVTEKNAIPYQEAVYNAKEVVIRGRSFQLNNLPLPTVVPKKVPPILTSLRLEGPCKTILEAKPLIEAKTLRKLSATIGYCYKWFKDAPMKTQIEQLELDTSTYTCMSLNKLKIHTLKDIMRIFPAKSNRSLKEFHFVVGEISDIDEISAFLQEYKATLKHFTLELTSCVTYQQLQDYSKLTKIMGNQIQVRIDISRINNKKDDKNEGLEEVELKDFGMYLCEDFINMLNYRYVRKDKLEMSFKDNPNITIITHLSQIGGTLLVF